MSDTETIQVQVDDGHVAVQLHRPQGGAPEHGWPMVLRCDALPHAPDEHRALIDEVAGRLVASGVLVVGFLSRLATLTPSALAAQRAGSIIDDAAAVFRWAALCDDIDMDRIAVLGAGSGAIVAATLAGRTDRIAGLCLVAPPTPEALVARPAADGRNGRHDDFSESLLDLHAVDEAAAYDRPTLIMQGASDRGIGAAGPGQYLNRIENADHRAEHLYVARAGSTFEEPEARETCVGLVCEFLVGLPALAAASPAS